MPPWEHVQPGRGGHWFALNWGPLEGGRGTLNNSTGTKTASRTSGTGRHTGHPGLKAFRDTCHSLRSGQQAWALPDPALLRQHLGDVQRTPQPPSQAPSLWGPPWGPPHTHRATVMGPCKAIRGARLAPLVPAALDFLFCFECRPPHQAPQRIWTREGSRSAIPRVCAWGLGPVSGHVQCGVQAPDS